MVYIEKKSDIRHRSHIFIRIDGILVGNQLCSCNEIGTTFGLN